MACARRLSIGIAAPLGAPSRQWSLWALFGETLNPARERDFWSWIHYTCSVIGISLIIVLRTFALLFISFRLILAFLIIFVAFAIEFANAVESWNNAALQKKLLDLPSSNCSIIVSSNLIRFFCCCMNFLIPCSCMKYRFGKIFLHDGYEEDSFTFLYSSALLNFAQGKSEHSEHTSRCLFLTQQVMKEHVGCLS